jgi:hypothetical protein
LHAPKGASKLTGRSEIILKAENVNVAYYRANGGRTAGGEKGVFIPLTAVATGTAARML